MNPNLLPSSVAQLAAAINPGAQAVGSASSGWVKMANFANLMVIIAAGTLGASGTVDAKIEQATDASGTGVKDVSGKAITQITTSDKQAIINLSADDLDSNNGFLYARVTVTVGTADSDVAAMALGFDARYQPGSQVSSVLEVVS